MKLTNAESLKLYQAVLEAQVYDENKIKSLDKKQLKTIEAALNTMLHGKVHKNDTNVISPKIEKLIQQLNISESEKNIDFTSSNTSTEEAKKKSSFMGSAINATKKMLSILGFKPRFEVIKSKLEKIENKQVFHETNQELLNILQSDLKIEDLEDEKNPQTKHGILKLKVENKKELEKNLNEIKELKKQMGRFPLAMSKKAREVRTSNQAKIRELKNKNDTLKAQISESDKRLKEMAATENKLIKLIKAEENKVGHTKIEDYTSVKDRLEAVNEKIKKTEDAIQLVKERQETMIKEQPTSKLEYKQLLKEQLERGKTERNKHVIKISNTELKKVNNEIKEFNKPEIRKLQEIIKTTENLLKKLTKEKVQLEKQVAKESKAHEKGIGKPTEDIIEEFVNVDKGTEIGKEIAFTLEDLPSEP